MIVTLDDDLQNPPEEILRLLTKLEEGYDVVYGALERRNPMVSLANQASRITKLVLKGAMGTETERKTRLLLL
ncbi:MAG: glycosyltransferase [Gammaproteobacteria bacterium]